MYLDKEQFNALMLITRKYERNELYDSYGLTPALNFLLQNKLVESTKCIRTSGAETNVFKPTPAGWKIITKNNMPIELASKPLPTRMGGYIETEADLWEKDLNYVEQLN